MKLAFLAAFTCALLSAATPKLTFTKSFPGSTPAFVFIQIERTGGLQYKESTDEQPLVAQMKDTDVVPLFSLAEKLGYFKAPIESGLKVANTGKKVFRYDPETGASSETTFNYSLRPEAQQLLDLFEQIAASERAYVDLDRAIHFDKLGVNDSLAEIESLWLRKQLTAPEQFVPLLTRIATHTAFMHLVRDRAARLRDEFTGTVPQTANTDSKGQ